MLGHSPTAIHKTCKSWALKAAAFLLRPGLRKSRPLPQAPATQVWSAFIPFITGHAGRRDLPAATPCLERFIW
jgi:hypothetical protein